LARRFAAEGHRVAAALRDISRAQLVRGEDRVEVYQAPTKVRISEGRIVSPTTFADILHNVGFGNRGELSSMVGAWQNLYRLLKPDLIVFDHSPTALLASGAEPAKRILLGPGFYVPPARYPMPRVRHLSLQEQQQPPTAEDNVLLNANFVRQNMGLHSLCFLAELYANVDENLLTTFEELDPYERDDQVYWGTGPSLAGLPPQWPAGNKTRIFAYLKPFPALAALLKHLGNERIPTIICADGIDRRLQRESITGTLRFAEGLVDLKEACRDCDLALFNGTHATTVAALLAGRPILQIPITGEQFLTAERTVKMGCGLMAPPTDFQAITSQLARVVQSPDFGRAARQFAARYDGFDHEQQLLAVSQRIASHLLERISA